jgi:hypothetical protein
MNSRALSLSLAALRSTARIGQSQVRLRTAQHSVLLCGVCPLTEARLLCATSAFFCPALIAAAHEDLHHHHPRSQRSHLGNSAFVPHFCFFALIAALVHGVTAALLPACFLF